MNRPCAACLLAILLSLPAPAHGQPLETLKAGVVKLYVQKADGLDDTGAGIVVGSSKGTLFILTAYHVVEDADSIQVTFDAERWNACAARGVHKFDENMDIAVVLVDFEAPDTPPANLPKYQIRETEPQDNEAVIAIGHPEDAREWFESREEVALKRTEDLFGFLITRSQAERGFSGGPVFDEEGALLGMVVSVKPMQTKVVLTQRAREKLEIWKLPANHLIAQGATAGGPETPPGAAGDEKTEVADAGEDKSEATDTGFGTILVKTRPDVTRVRLDLREMGVTENGALTLENVEPGKYMLYVMQEGYLSWREVIEVKADREILVSARLEKKESGGAASGGKSSGSIQLQPIKTPTLVLSAAAIQASCARLVQGKIAWDYTGTKRWGTANLERLCKGTKDATQPPRCFERAMHGGIDMGRGTRWTWQDALDLCEGTDDAARTLSCFEAGIRRKYSQKDAIQKCSK